MTNTRIQLWTNGNGFKLTFMLYGTALVAAGMLMPVLLQVKWLNAFPNLIMAIENIDQGLLILTASQVVLVYALRAFPLFLGTFIISDEIRHLRFGWSKTVARLSPVVIIPLAYWLISNIYGSAQGFVTPVILTLLCIVASWFMRKNDPSFASRALVIVLVVFGVQWLDVMPVMDRLGSGRGEVFREIKHVARFMQAEPALDFIGFLFLGFALILVTLLLRLLVVHNRVLQQERHDREREQQLQMVRMAALESKAFSEVRSLTHDLKTPLTAIQGLTSVLLLLVESQKEQVVAICERINRAAENMNEMITDIMLQERRQPIDVLELLNYTTAQVSPKQGNTKIALVAQEGLPRVAGNRVRLTRALANLLENSLDAILRGGKDVSGMIDISVRSLSDHRVRIVITDNGAGVAEQDKPRLFDLGFSTKGTAGLGLPFTAQVIRDHGGTIELWSVAGVGTKVVVCLPEVIEN